MWLRRVGTQRGKLLTLIWLCFILILNEIIDYFSDVKLLLYRSPFCLFSLAFTHLSDNDLH